MLAIVVIENGQKKYIPLTADAGAGNPVGTLIHTYKKSNPSGYLYCDGSTFDQTKYPLLYAYLGSNVLPDYRECVEVGAEQNTTDTIATHDVYTEGQFKDDQLQQHDHDINPNPNIALLSGGQATYGSSDANIGNLYGKKTGNVSTGRTGTTTHGKQKAVFVYIKATSGLSENAQDNVINTLNEQRSYSTTEVNTGKKWINGKDIYSKTFYNVSNFPCSAGLTNVDEIIKIDAVAIDVNSNFYPLPFVTVISGVTYYTNIYYNKNNNAIYSDSNSNIEGVNVTLEYTKTN
jgi:hypothetical protein